MSSIDVSKSSYKGRKLKKQIEELLTELKEKDKFPSVIKMNKEQYRSVQESRKLRRLKGKYEFLKLVSPPENFLFYTKQHVMGVEVDETR